MRRALLFFAGLGVAITSPDARGDDDARPSLAMTWASPTFRSLPEGHLRPVPEGPRPVHISAAEQLAGFVVTPPKAPEQKARHVPLTRRGKHAPPQALSPRGFATLSAGVVKADQAALAVCFADDTNAVARQWPADVSAKLGMHFDLGKPGQSVRAAHAERLVAGNRGVASLEVTDAWVDLRTSGVRAVARYELPLARVFEGPNGLEVYAARDEGALQVVVHAPTGAGDVAPDTAHAVLEELGSLGVKLPDGSDASSDCGHLRFALGSGPGTAEMATLRSFAILSPLRGEGGLVVDSNDAPPPVRHRPFQFSVSATQSLSDDEPIVSLSLGWIGGEQSASNE